MPEQVDYERLKEIQLFKNLDDGELSIISRKIFIKPYKKDATLFVEGMPGEILYIVEEGGVDIYKKTPKGEIKVANIGPGEIVGEMSLIDDEPRSASGRTNTDSKLIVITKKSFNEILESDPKIAAKICMSLLKIISKENRKIFLRLSLFMFLQLLAH